MNIVNFKKQQIRVFEEGKSNTKAGVFYPGLAYSLQSPAFFYLMDLFRHYNYDLVGIDYRYNENTEFMNSPEHIRKEWFAYDSEAIGKAVQSKVQKYEEVVHVGKSLGTAVLMRQIEMGMIGVASKLVWLTPGGSSREIYGLLKRIENRSLVIAGSADSFFRPEYIEGIKDCAHVELMILEDAGHVFEEKGNIEKSINNLRDVVKRVEGYIQKL